MRVPKILTRSFPEILTTCQQQRDVIDYLQERNHQGLGNQLIVPLPPRAIGDERILSCERLGGLLNYHRPAPVTVADVRRSCEHH